MADIAVSVDDVGSLGETNVGDVELSDLSGIVDLDVVDNGETIADSLGETTTALLVEVGGEAIDDTEEEHLVVGGGIGKSLLGLLRGRGLLEVGVLVDRGSTSLGHVGGGSAHVLVSLLAKSVGVDFVLKKEAILLVIVINLI